MYNLQEGKCYFCGGLLHKIHSDIHHKNGDHGDNRRSNRCLIHKSCHMTHHWGKDNA